MGIISESLEGDVGNRYHRYTHTHHDADHCHHPPPLPPSPSRLTIPPWGSPSSLCCDDLCYTGPHERGRRRQRRRYTQHNNSLVLRLFDSPFTFSLFSLHIGKEGEGEGRSLSIIFSYLFFFIDVGGGTETSTEAPQTNLTKMTCINHETHTGSWGEGERPQLPT